MLKQHGRSNEGPLEHAKSNFPPMHSRGARLERRDVFYTNARKGKCVLLVLDSTKAPFHSEEHRSMDGK